MRGLDPYYLSRFILALKIETDSHYQIGYFACGHTRQLEEFLGKHSGVH